MSLCSYSLNVRGMLERKAIFLYLKRFRADFYFLQENHTLWTEFKFLEKSLGVEIFGYPMVLATQWVLQF